jgi:hypothetical protein
MKIQRKDLVKDALVLSSVSPESQRLTQGTLGVQAMETNTQSLNNWYLIQRGAAPSYKNSRAKGFDLVVEWDYMGSTEFETGGLSKACRKFRELGSSGNLKLSKISFADDLDLADSRFSTLHVIHDAKFDLQVLKSRFLELFHGKHRTKESTYMESFSRKMTLARSNVDSYWNRTTFWINIVDTGRTDGYDAVAWTTSKRLANLFFAEASHLEPTPNPLDVPENKAKKPAEVSSSSLRERLRMFDTVIVNHKRVHGQVQICGIYDNYVDVKTQDGTKFTRIPYSSITCL